MLMVINYMVVQDMVEEYFFYNNQSPNVGVQHYRYYGNGNWDLIDENKLSTGECYVRFTGTAENLFRAGNTYNYLIGA